MCGRFAQYQASQTIWPSAEQDVISEYGSVPIARYNVAPSNKVHMLHGETRGIHLGAVRWGWAPHWGSRRWRGTRRRQPGDQYPAGRRRHADHP